MTYKTSILALTAVLALATLATGAMATGNGPVICRQDTSAESKLKDCNPCDSAPLSAEGKHDTKDCNPCDQKDGQDGASSESRISRDPCTEVPVFGSVTALGIGAAGLVGAALIVLRRRV